jgi:MFS family permease
MAGELVRRFGMGRVLTSTMLLASLFGFLTPLASGSVFTVMAMLMTTQLISDAAMTVFMINEMTLRQTLIDERLLGRASASMGFLSQGAAPFGGIVAGVLATLIGARLTLLIAVIGGLAVALWLRWTPVRQIETMETAEVVEAVV